MDRCFRKPDVRIANVLAQNVGHELHDALVIGDGIVDIELAHNLGLPSAWITRGKTWPSESTFQPTIETAEVTNAIEMGDGQVTGNG